MSMKMSKHWRLAERGPLDTEPDPFRKRVPVDLAEHGGYWVVNSALEKLRDRPYATIETAQREADLRGGKVVADGWLKRRLG
jgi:hypothetical protein